MEFPESVAPHCSSPQSCWASNSLELDVAHRLRQPALRAVVVLETWDAVYMADTKVGSIHTVFESIEQQGQTMIQVSSHSKLELKRFGQSAVLQTRSHCHRDRTGRGPLIPHGNFSRPNSTYR